MKIKWLHGIGDSRLHISGKRLFKNRQIPKQIYLNYGNFKKYMRVKINRQLPKNTIGLSSNAFLPFSIPTNLPYSIRITETDIFVGPVIGMLIPSQRPLDHFAWFFQDYKNIGGLVFLFSVEHINPVDQTIQGFYYDPDADHPSLKWKRIVAPYPNTVYNRSKCSKIPSEFINQINDKIFNSPVLFDKWELWRILSENPEVRGYLPNTLRLYGISELDTMLQSYNTVYVKRLQSLQSLGLFLIRRMEEGYLFTDRDCNETLVPSAAAADFIENLINKSPYLVQQAVPLKYHDRHVDFRVILQKGRAKTWRCTGVLARFGARGSVSTNFTESGYLRLGEAALQKVFRLNQTQAAEKIEEIIRVCKSACEWLDQFGNFADVGVDVVVDPNQDVWILEINRHHHFGLPLYIKGNDKMYKRVIAKPLKFAKSFAGF